MWLSDIVLGLNDYLLSKTGWGASLNGFLKQESDFVYDIRLINLNSTLSESDE